MSLRKVTIAPQRRGPTLRPRPSALGASRRAGASKSTDRSLPTEAKLRRERVLATLGAVAGDSPPALGAALSDRHLALLYSLSVAQARQHMPGVAAVYGGSVAAVVAGEWPEEGWAWWRWPKGPRFALYHLGELFAAGDPVAEASVRAYIDALGEATGVGRSAEGWARPGLLLPPIDRYRLQQLGSLAFVIPRLYPGLGQWRWALASPRAPAVDPHGPLLASDSDSTPFTSSISDGETPEEYKESKRAHGVLLALARRLGGSESALQALYRISFDSHGYHGLLNQYQREVKVRYGNSSFAFLATELPHHPWKPWKFALTPRNWWEDLVRQAQRGCAVAQAVGRGLAADLALAHGLLRPDGSPDLAALYTTSLYKPERAMLDAFGGKEAALAVLGVEPAPGAEAKASSARLPPPSELLARSQELRAFQDARTSEFWRRPGAGGEFFQTLRQAIGGPLDLLYDLSVTYLLAIGGKHLLDLHRRSVGVAVMESLPPGVAPLWRPWLFHSSPLGAWEVFATHLSDPVVTGDQRREVLEALARDLEAKLPPDPSRPDPAPSTPPTALLSNSTATMASFATPSSEVAWVERWRGLWRRADGPTRRRLGLLRAHLPLLSLSPTNGGSETSVSPIFRPLEAEETRGWDWTAPTAPRRFFDRILGLPDPFPTPVDLMTPGSAATVAPRPAPALLSTPDAQKLSTLYSLSPRSILALGGGRLMGGWKGTVGGVLGLAYPTHPWRPWRFVSPPRHWFRALALRFWAEGSETVPEGSSARAELAEFFADLQAQFGLQTPQQWLQFEQSSDGRRLSYELGEAGPLGRLVGALLGPPFGSSPPASSKHWKGQGAVAELGLSGRWWEAPAQILRYLDLLRHQITPDGSMDGLYRLNRRDLVHSGGKRLLQVYNQSIEELCRKMYPDHQWEWWRFGKTEKDRWRRMAALLRAQPPSQEAEHFARSYTKSIGDQMGIGGDLSLWERTEVPRRRKAHLRLLGGLPRLLAVAYPDHAWNWPKRSADEPLKRSWAVQQRKSQRSLRTLLGQALPDFDIHEEMKLSELNIAVPDGLEISGASRVDLVAPKARLAVEFHGEQHYTSRKSSAGVSILVPRSKSQERVDREKGQVLAEAGFSLLEIPYWWDRKLESLRAAIGQIRPDLIKSQPPKTWK